MPTSPASTALEPASGCEPASPVVTSRAALVVYKGSVTEADPERRTQAYGQDQAAEPVLPPKPSSTIATSEIEPDRRRIGDFLVRRLIGEGGMGKVYEAEERLSKRRVAL
jgi:serine/threonine protein kinase